MYRILIADDEPMIRKGLRKLAEQSGQPVAGIRTAQDGADALQQIREERPDFLFTDIRMPRLDGLELCRQVSELDADIQIVVISGFSDFEYAKRCMSYGVKEYLLKPVNKSMFHETLAKLTKLAMLRQSQAFVPVTLLQRWADGMEEAIWSLQQAELDGLLQEVKEKLESYHLLFAQWCDVLAELHALVLQRFHSRDVLTLQAELPLPEANDPGQAWQRFELSLRRRYDELKAKRKGNLKDPVEEAKKYIELHLAEELSLEEVAKYIGLNASYFSQLFKQSTQETFVQYRSRRRMEKAKKLLMLPHYRITDISVEVGYGDHPHFTKTFKKYTGCLPSEFRHKMGIE